MVEVETSLGEIFAANADDTSGDVAAAGGKAVDLIGA